MTGTCKTKAPALLPAWLAALAIGHQRSAMEPAPQTRWRFTSGVMSVGAFQTIAIFAIGNGVLKYGPVFIVGTVAAWVVSLMWFGRKVVSGWN